MNREKSIKALISKSWRDFQTLKQDYKRSLDQEVILEEMKIDIKNIFENLRSCLDYMAHDIFEFCENGKKLGKLYFPIRWSRKDFDQVVKKDFPSLHDKNPDIYKILERVQPYNNDWLSKFNKLNNNNKHKDLVEQTKTISRQVTVSSDQGSVSWGPGVTFGSGVSVMGVPIDPKTQMPISNNQVKTDVTIWVDFRFKENGESVLSFMELSIRNIEQVFRDLSAHII